MSGLVRYPTGKRGASVREMVRHLGSLIAGTVLASVAVGAQGNAQHDHAAVGPPGASVDGELKISKVMRAPGRFVGNVIRDPQSGRLWLLSFGPPANTVDSSTLYEVEPSTGSVISRRSMPFLGEFGTAAYIDGFFYQAIAYESTMYKVDASETAQRDGIVGTVKLPTHGDIDSRDEDVYRFPFIAFTAATPASDGNVQLYAADLGELITVDKTSGAVIKRVRTTKGLGGLTRATIASGESLLLGTFDPVDSAFKQETRRFMFRASHGILPLETVRAEGNYGQPGQKTVTWVLLDAESGEVLASTSIESSRMTVGSVAFVKAERAPGTRFGKLVALTTGDEGIVTVEWTPR